MAPSFLPKRLRNTARSNSTLSVKRLNKENVIRQCILLACLGAGSGTGNQRNQVYYKTRNQDGATNSGRGSAGWLSLVLNVNWKPIYQPRSNFNWTKKTLKYCWRGRFCLLFGGEDGTPNNLFKLCTKIRRYYYHKSFAVSKAAPVQTVGSNNCEIAFDYLQCWCSQLVPPLSSNALRLTKRVETTTKTMANGFGFAR